eukprot:6118312-Amphidinium_carterae.1
MVDAKLAKALGHACCIASLSSKTLCVRDGHIAWVMSHGSWKAAEIGVEYRIKADDPDLLARMEQNIGWMMGK